MRSIAHLISQQTFQGLSFVTAAALPHSQTCQNAPARHSSLVRPASLSAEKRRIHACSASRTRLHRVLQRLLFKKKYSEKFSQALSARIAEDSCKTRAIRRRGSAGPHECFSPLREPRGSPGEASLVFAESVATERGKVLGKFLVLILQ